ncbi:MAG TPA: N-acetyltransferase [Terriglobales bacterium]|nr:N-acetyltransferase [Terriglobales bacterium]
MRRATLPDVEQIHDLIHGYSETGTLLPRSLAELCENVRDFIVVEDEGRIIGCGALHLYGRHLTEIRSIAVYPEYKGKGAGRLLVEGLLAEAEHHTVNCVCLFTRIPDFFSHFGFRVAKREELPDKIYKDCMNCPKLHACDEIAMVRGEVPKFAILEPANKELDYNSGLVNLQ